jgi:hypothetical protein
MPFEKGKPKTGGRKKGVRNKTTLKFRDRLEANGVDIEQELAKAILSGNVDLIKALQSLLPYLQPRLKETDSAAQPTPKASLDAEVESLNEEDLLNLVKGEDK